MFAEVRSDGNAPLVEKRHTFDTSEIREHIRVQLVIVLQRKLLEK